MMRPASCWNPLKPHVRWSGKRVTPKMAEGTVLIAVALWLALGNRQVTRIRVLVPVVTAPAWLFMGVAFGGGMLAGIWVRRGRK